MYDITLCRPGLNFHLPLCLNSIKLNHNCAQYKTKLLRLYKCVEFFPNKQNVVPSSTLFLHMHQNRPTQISCPKACPITENKSPMVKRVVPNLAQKLFLSLKSSCSKNVVLGKDLQLGNHLMDERVGLAFKNFLRTS